jgi:hypothetical protein
VGHWLVAELADEYGLLAGSPNRPKRIPGQIGVRLNSAARQPADAMVRAADDISAGKLSAKDWFVHERTNFMRAVNEGIGARVGRQAAL